MEKLKTVVAELIDQQIKRLVEIKGIMDVGNSLQRNEARIKYRRWRNQTHRILEESANKDEAEQFKAQFLQSSADSLLSSDVQRLNSFLKLVVDGIMDDTVEIN